MALTVEDGTIVTGADSYITLAAARTYAASRGVSLSATDATAEVQLRKAFDFIEAMQAKFQGIKVSQDPTDASWPRSDVWVDGLELSSTEIPNNLKYAQVQYAAAVQSGVDLNPTQTGKFVKREKIDVIEVEYSESIATSALPVVRTAESLLRPLLKQTSAITTVRV